LDSTVHRVRDAPLPVAHARGPAGKKNGTAPAEGRPAVAAARAQLMFEKVAARGASPGLVRPSVHLGESLLDSTFCIDAKSWPVDPNEAASADADQV